MSFASFALICILAGQGPVKQIGIGIGWQERITSIQIRAVLLRHRVHVTKPLGTDMSETLTVPNPPSGLIKWLASEAPPSRFAFAVWDTSDPMKPITIRDDLEIPKSKGWKTLTGKKIFDMRSDPIPLAELARSEHINASEISSMSFVARPYLGLDLKPHVGYDFVAFGPPTTKEQAAGFNTPEEGKPFWKKRLECYWDAEGAHFSHAQFVAPE